MDNNFCNRKTMRAPNYDYNTPGTYFLTLCTRDKKCLLSNVVGNGVLDVPYIELTDYGKIADKYINQMNHFYKHVSVERYVIMPNHIHMLLRVLEEDLESGSSRTPIPTRQNSIVSLYVSTFKRFCNKEYGTNIWQSHFYDRIIRDLEDYETHANYIYMNPIRWYNDELYSAF